jgi:hypothetical protein
MAVVKSEEQIEKRLFAVADKMTQLQDNKNRTKDEQNELIRCIAYTEALAWALSIDLKTEHFKFKNFNPIVIDGDEVIAQQKLKLKTVG